jgi:8-oxo-dGTP diphosphatase
METRFYVAGHALIQHEEQYLIMRRSPANDYLPGTWDIPGGTVDPGETVAEAIKREVLEETGLEVEVLRVLHVFSNLSQLPARQTCQIIFRCRYLGGDVRLNPLEHDEYQWIAANELARLPLIPFLADFYSASRGHLT